MAAQLRAARLIPVLTINDAACAVPLAEALHAGGVTAIEITLRTPAAIAAITAIRNRVPALLAGIGTVLHEADLDLAADLDLPFAFSPGATPALMGAAARRGARFIPGIATATELMQAMQHGFNLVKLFPAVPCGGVATLCALSGPLPAALFCPTGGITPQTAGAFLAEPNVVAVGGSWFAPPGEQAAGAWQTIAARAAQSFLASRPAP